MCARMITSANKKVSIIKCTQSMQYVNLVNTMYNDTLTNNVHTHTQTQVSSLRSRLEQVSRELQEMARKKAEGEQRMSHALEELQRDKAMLQRDLATARWELQLTSHGIPPGQAVGVDRLCAVLSTNTCSVTCSTTCN